jgi:DNA-binding NtrC family response regulator
LKNKLSLLLIQDDKIEVDAFRDFFKKNGQCCDYTIAKSVKEALYQFKNRRFDVVISDIFFFDGHMFDILPGAGRTPFIVVTDNGCEELAILSMNRGAYEYFVRDIERTYLQVLLEVIKKGVAPPTHSRSA